MPYDVFITCGSEDNEKAEPVYHWLVEQGYHPFFAPINLKFPKTSSSPISFYDEIDDALDTAENMIVFTSNAEYVKKGSVKDEWRIFLEEQRAGRKVGSLVTILDGIAIADLPIRLRSVQTFTPDDYKQGILHFLRSRGRGEKNEIEEQPAREEIDESKYVLVGEGKSVLTCYDVDKNATHIRIADSVNSIAGLTFFFGNRRLVSIIIPNSVTSIGDDAFGGCSRLASIIIPNSVTSIGDDAFGGCSGLTTLVIPKNVTLIKGSFSGCSGLKSIIVDKENKQYDSRNNCNAIIETSTNKLIAGCYRTMIPDSVTSIGSGAFSGCNKLTSIVIPDSVTAIGGYSFSGCSGLASIVIPNSVNSIGEWAFNGCCGLTRIDIPKSVTSIGNLAFNECYGLSSITVDKENKIYDSRNNCNAIIETSTNELIAGCCDTVIPDSVTAIGDCAFSGCSGLTSIIIPDNVTAIGYKAFFGCSGLASFVIPNSVTSIGYEVFNECHGLTSIVIPNSVTFIGNAAFGGCSGLTSIVIPNSVTLISEAAFSGCSKLTSIVIPDSVTSIESWAFEGCDNLKTVYIRNKDTKYEETSFPSHTEIIKG